MKTLKAHETHCVCESRTTRSSVDFFDSFLKKKIQELECEANIDKV